VIVDASLVIDAVADPGPRGVVARRALADHVASEPLVAPGHFAIELMSGLRAAANRPGHPLTAEDVDTALSDAQSLEITIEATPWADVHRAWELARGLLRYPDGIYVAAAERHAVALITSDARIGRSGAHVRTEIITVVPDDDWDTQRGTNEAPGL
jgi:predicted nucleic acid-binding protein